MRDYVTAIEGCAVTRVLGRAFREVKSLAKLPTSLEARSASVVLRARDERRRKTTVSGVPGRKERSGYREEPAGERTRPAGGRKPENHRNRRKAERPKISAGSGAGRGAPVKVRRGESRWSIEHRKGRRKHIELRPTYFDPREPGAYPKRG